jgi:hypothetical protein
MVLGLPWFLLSKQAHLLELTDANTKVIRTHLAAFYHHAAEIHMPQNLKGNP